VILEDGLIDAKLCEAFDDALELDERHSDTDELNDADTDAQIVEIRVPDRVADTLEETLNEKLPDAVTEPIGVAERLRVGLCELLVVVEAESVEIPAHLHVSAYRPQHASSTSAGHSALLELNVAYADGVIYGLEDVLVECDPELVCDCEAHALILLACMLRVTTEDAESELEAEELDTGAPLLAALAVPAFPSFTRTYTSEVPSLLPPEKYPGSAPSSHARHTSGVVVPSPPPPPPEPGNKTV